MVAQGSPIRQFTWCCSSNSPASGREGEVYAKNEDFEICNQTMSNWSFIGVCICISVHRQTWFCPYGTGHSNIHIKLCFSPHQRLFTFRSHLVKPNELICFIIAQLLATNVPQIAFIVCSISYSTWFASPTTTSSHTHYLKDKNRGLIYDKAQGFGERIAAENRNSPSNRCQKKAGGFNWARLCLPPLTPRYERMTGWTGVLSAAVALVVMQALDLFHVTQLTE